MHNEDEMKRKGQEPATKNDLWAHEAATKSQLQAHEAATKSQLQAHEAATRNDSQSLRNDFQALRGDFKAHVAATKDEFKAVSSRFDRLERVVKKVAVDVSGFKTALVEMSENFSAVLTQRNSELMDRLDGFMAKTLKVERDEVWLIHRVDNLEDRVTRIEKKSP